MSEAMKNELITRLTKWKEERGIEDLKPIVEMYIEKIREV